MLIYRLTLLYQDEAHLYMLTEALMGGELFTLLCTHDTFDAATARFYLAQVTPVGHLGEARGWG